MNLTNFQENLHRLYQGDDDTPSVGTDDYKIRTTLAEAAVEAWYTEEGVLWRELFTTLADASDGDKAADGGVDFDCPTNFRKPGGYVRVEDTSGNFTYYTVISPPSGELYKNEDANVCWFRGNVSDGFKLYFDTAPTSGLTIDYPYYKAATAPSSAALIFEMSDPWFAIQLALSKLHEHDGEGDRAGLALGKASAKLRSMKVNNVVPAWFQSNAVPDRDFVIGRGGFGV